MVTNDTSLLLLKLKLLYLSNNIDSGISLRKSNLAYQNKVSTVYQDIISPDKTISYKANPLTKVQTWQKQVINASPYVPSGKGMHFVIKDYLNSGQEKYTEDGINPQHLQNAYDLLDKINQIGELIDYDGIISSGYRSPQRQRQIYAEKGEPPAMGSKHLSGHALDIADPRGDLKKKILNRSVLEKARELGLYFENFGKTPTWVHIQDEAPGYVGGQIWSADNLLERNNL